MAGMEDKRLGIVQVGCQFFTDFSYIVILRISYIILKINTALGQIGNITKNLTVSSNPNYK